MACFAQIVIIILILSWDFPWFCYAFPIIFLWGFIGPIGPWAIACVRRTGKWDSLDVAALACSSFSTCSPRGTCAPLGPHAPLELHAKTATSKASPIGQLRSMYFWDTKGKVYLEVATFACSSFSACSPRGTYAPLGPHAPPELHPKAATYTRNLNMHPKAAAYTGFPVAAWVPRE